MDKTKLNLERLRAYDAEWDENKHPRADNGQFTSGGGSAGGGAGSSNTGGSSSASSTKKYNQKDLLKLANNHLNYHLGYNETDATADKVEIVSEPDEHGNVDAKVSYDVTVRIPYQETDWDGYTHTTYEEDSEYRTDIIPLNISDLKPEEPEAPKSPLRQAAETIQGGGGKKDTSYTANSQQTKADKAIRENPDYVGNDEVYKLLGGKDKVDYFKFITPISTHGYINSKDDITIEYGDVYHNDKGERRVSTTTTTFYADKIFKSL